ncbi:MAG: 50S ribosomal protein L18 [Candidatus Anstonellales archaeon]
MGRAKGPRYVVPFRRRRIGRTRYKKRFALLRSSKPRFVVRKKNRDVIVQIVDFGYEGDRVLVTVNGKTIAKQFNWPSRRNMPTAYLIGLYAAKLAKQKGVTEAVPDIGLHSPTKGSIVFGAIKGAIDGGLKMNMNMEISPERISGKHVAEYAKVLKEKGEEEYKKRFASYLKQEVNPEKIPELFEQVVKKIRG